MIRNNDQTILLTNPQPLVPTRFPLHPAQNEVFKAQMLDTENPLYNIGAYVRLTGPLNKEQFKIAAGSAPGVFDAFRMRFEIKDAEAVCFFETGYDLMEINECDFSLSSNPAEEAKQWVQQRFQLAFDIQSERLLFENILIKIGPNEHWFFMRYHHLIMDGYGFKVWLRYLATQYRFVMAGLEVPHSYPQYKPEISRSNEYRNSSYFRQDQLYWSDRIAEKPKPLLQARYQHRQSATASTFTCHLTDVHRNMLLDLQAKTQTSLQHLTIAALLIYFGRISGETDFIFGILLHKRESKQMRNVVGMFSDILPFRGSFNEEATLLDFLKEIAFLQKKDYRHKNYLAGDVSRHHCLHPYNENLCDVVVNYELFKFELDFDSAITAAVMQLSSNHERIPLQICWQDFGNQQPLQLQFIFRNDYFTTEEIALLARRLLFLFNQFSLKTEDKTGSYSILPPEEREMLQTFNQTQTQFAFNNSIIELFERQVVKSPDKTALVFNDKKLTYQQLNDNANQLARYLKQNGVKESDLVPVFVERSVQMIVGIVAILKAGATYVPIDPANPEERTRYILGDTAATLILTTSSSRSMLPDRVDAVCIDLDKAQASIAGYPAHNLPAVVPPTNLVYVMYTSGSTGKPKGVEMPGSNLVNLLEWQDQQFMHPDRHVLQFSCLNFDVSFQEIFSTLCYGGSLYLIQEGQRSDMSALSAVVHHFGITHLFLPVVVLQSLAEYVNSTDAQPLPLKVIIVAGEQLKLGEDVRQLLNCHRITLINQYGPTEAHVVSSYTIDPDTAISLLPPIGKPIHNTAIHILNSRLEILPLGIAGEIGITGAGVARGYLRNEALTKERFVANPGGEGKMYRTGDIGRWLPDGNLEYIGRLDDQVKIRGYRVETGEIESVLLQCSNVSQCCVTVKKRGKDTKQLICYVVTKQSFSQNELVAFLETRVPGYMIPSLFIPLSSLPVTATGKVDKHALPDPDAFLMVDHKTPGPGLETALLQIWKEMLGVETVGITDNFFELGGHSLLVAKAVGRIKKETGKNVAPASLFQYPTVEKYAKFLLEKHPTETTKHIVPVNSGGGKLPLYIICPIALAPLKHVISLAGVLDEAQPVYGIYLHDLDEMEVESMSVESIATKYVAEILAHRLHDTYLLAGYSIGGLIAFEMAKQLKEKGKQIKFLGLFDTVAYSKRQSKLSFNLFSLFKELFRACSRLKKLAFGIYYLIDNELYLLRFDAKTFVWRRKNRLTLYVKRLFKFVRSPEQKEESTLLWENMQKLAITAYKKYKLTFYEGDITLFRARRRTVNIGDPFLLGWKPFARSVKVYETEGNHYTMFESMYCQQLATMLQKCLDECNVESCHPVKD